MHASARHTGGDKAALDPASRKGIRGLWDDQPVVRVLVHQDCSGHLLGPTKAEGALLRIARPIDEQDP
eukprot:11250152-Alexandrium_andersonii.AAC.1